ncbi:hypothetical protein Tco_1362687 [Tanacetum coccineum]
MARKVCIQVLKRTTPEINEEYDTRMDGPEDELEKGFWKCLRTMFEEPLSTDPIWSELGQQKIIRIDLSLGQGLTSPEQTATCKGISKPSFIAVMLPNKPFSGGPKTDDSRVNRLTGKEDINPFKIYNSHLSQELTHLEFENRQNSRIVMYKIVNVADIMDCLKNFEE